MVDIKEMVITNLSNTYGHGNPCNYLTIHETANTSAGANAEMHNAYLRNQLNGGRAVSWQYTVDSNSIVQNYKDDVQCWHAGDGSGPGNTESIGIEMCVNSDGDFSKTVENTVELVNYLMEKHNISTQNVKQHHYFSSYGKDCPNFLRAGHDGWTWTKFINACDGIHHVSKNSNKTGRTFADKSTKELAQMVINGELGNGSQRKEKLGIRYDAVQSKVNNLLAGNDEPKKSVKELAQAVIDGKFGVGAERKQALGNRYDEVQAKVNDILNGGNDKPKKSINELAHMVLDGKFGNGDQRRQALGSRYDEVQNRVNEIVNGGNTSHKKTVNELAHMVLQGKLGNGQERREALGNRYDEVQSRVNEIVNGGANKNRKSVNELAHMVINGEFGNGTERKEALGSRYDEVQARVNELL